MEYTSEIIHASLWSTEEELNSKHVQSLKNTYTELNLPTVIRIGIYSLLSFFFEFAVFKLPVPKFVKILVNKLNVNSANLSLAE